MKESRVANANENILELMDYFIGDLQDRGYRKVTPVRGAGKTAGPSPKTFFAVDSTDTVKRIEVSVDGQYEDDIIAMFDRYSGGVVGSSIYQLCTADPESPDPKNPELIWWAGKTKEDFINDLADMWKVVRSQSPRVQESKKINERVLDYDTYDEFYKQGCEAYFEGKSLDEVPVTGNAWFREAWQEGWKESKAYDEEEYEAEYEDEYWEDYDPIQESTKLKEDTNSERKEMQALFKKAARKAKVKILDTYVKSKRHWSVTLDTEDEYDADKFRYAIDDLLGENSGTHSYDDLEGLGTVHISVFEYYEYCDDDYRDLDPSIRDKYVVCCEPAERYKRRREMDW